MLYSLIPAETDQECTVRELRGSSSAFSFFQPCLSYVSTIACSPASKHVRRSVSVYWVGLSAGARGRSVVQRHTCIHTPVHAHPWSLAARRCVLVCFGVLLLMYHIMCGAIGYHETYVHGFALQGVRAVHLPSVVRARVFFFLSYFSV